MKERPILFSGPMVRALLDGTKTQTRRGVKTYGTSRVKRVLGPSSDGTFDFIFPDDRDPSQDGTGHLVACPYGVIGDRLWVRETFSYWECTEDWKPKKGERFEELSIKEQTKIINRVSDNGNDYIVYKADGAKRSLEEWKYPHPIYEHCIGRFDKTLPAIFMPRWAARLLLELTDVRVERVQGISEFDAIAEGVKPCGHTSFHVDEHTCSYHDLWDSLNAKRGYGWDVNPFVWVLTFKKL